MQIVEKAFLAPSICFLCEEFPTPDQRVVDTVRSFDPPSITKLNGRKYVCEKCVINLGKLFGLEAPEVVERLRVELAHSEAVVSELRDRARQIAEAVIGEHAIEVKVTEAKPRKSKSANVSGE